MMRIKHLLLDRTAAAAAEMAMVLPTLLVLIFGAFELGNYFLAEHVVQKGVRDASRYAARQPMDNFDCASGEMTNPTPVQRLARTGDPDGTTPRLRDWTDDGMAAVSVSCDDSGVYRGIYAEFPMGVPVVTVAATVPYTTFFGMAGLGPTTLNLNASQQAAVTGA